MRKLYTKSISPHGIIAAKKLSKRLFTHNFIPEFSVSGTELNRSQLKKRDVFAKLFLQKPYCRAKLFLPFLRINWKLSL